MPTQSYTLFGTGGTASSGIYVGLDATSKKCLSCHDGSVAVDSYGNGAAGPTTGTHYLGTTNDLTGSTAGYQIGAGGNLSHDHPVGVTYPGLSNDGTTWTSARGFKDPTKFNSSTYYSAIQNPNGSYNSINYVNDAGSNITATGGNSIGLDITIVNGVTYSNVVGCGACHTPHTNTYNFLRIPNTNSQLCLTCHDK
jgi:predicted CXXCH cytochrome family protein